MLYKFRDLEIEVISSNKSYFKILDDIYHNVRMSGISVIMKSFFVAIEDMEFTGEVKTTWSGFDSILFRYKNGKLHSSNKSHAAICNKNLKIFLQNGKLRKRDDGPCCTIYEMNKLTEKMFVDDDMRYNISETMTSSVYVKASTSHFIGSMYFVINNYKSKYGAKYIKKDKVYSYVNGKVDKQVSLYLKEHNLDYANVKKEDWPLILFQCNILTK
jgi:hypothetical protein